jgi:hypothetical protein
VCCHQLCLYISTFQKYSLHVPFQGKNPLLCRSCYFFNKNKRPKLLVSTNIRLNNDIDSI